jgi:hypothetical protein
MNLGQLRAEVLGHGFDPVWFPSARIDTYINDAYQAIVSAVNYFTTEDSQAVVTVVGTANIPWPADLGHLRSLTDTDQQRVLTQITLGDIDNAAVSRGRPTLYAADGATLRLYPTPDGTYNLLLRYWSMPPPLALDTDVPQIPAAWHRVLWYWGCKEAFAAEDDPTSAQYWEQQYNSALSELTADVKFPSDYPVAAESMWAV